MIASNCPLGTRSVPMNIRCSKRCANPLRPAGSSLPPTRYHVFTVATGSVWSSCRITVIPLSSVYFSYLTSWPLAAGTRPERTAAQSTPSVIRMGEGSEHRSPRQTLHPDPRHLHPRHPQRLLLALGLEHHIRPRRVRHRPQQLLPVRRVHPG